MSPGAVTPPPGHNRATVEHGRQTLVGVGGRAPSASAFGEGGAGIAPPNNQYSYPTIAELLLAEHERMRAESTTPSQGQDTMQLLQRMGERYYFFRAAARLEEENGEAFLIDTGAYYGLAREDWFDAHTKRAIEKGFGNMVTPPMLLFRVWARIQSSARSSRACQALRPMEN